LRAGRCIWQKRCKSAREISARDEIAGLARALQRVFDEAGSFHLGDEPFKYFGPASRPSGAAIAWRMSWKWPSMTRTFGWPLANCNSDCFTPAAASILSARKPSSANGDVG
jgi:hypothetical protein